jgi:hypothetical protein
LLAAPELLTIKVITPIGVADSDTDDEPPLLIHKAELTPGTHTRHASNIARAGQETQDLTPATPMESP